MGDPYDNYNGDNNINDNNNNNNNNRGNYNNNNNNNRNNSYNNNNNGNNNNNNNSGGNNNNNNYGANGSGGNAYNNNNKPGYNQNNGTKKKAWKKKVIPPSKVYLPVVLMFEKTVTESDVRDTLPEVIRWLQTNGYVIRVMGNEEIMSYVRGISKDILIVNHWDGFGEVKCNMQPTKFESFLARYIYPWLENQKDVISTFQGTNITALLGDAHYGRAYGMVTYTENGISDPQQLTDAYKYFRAPLELASIYQIPVINLGRGSYMDDLMSNLHNPNIFSPKESNNNRG